MAADLESARLRPMFDAFFNVSRRFDFLCIGPLCNGSRSRGFTDAYCDIKRIKQSDSSILNLPLCVSMNELFERAYDILDALKNEETIDLLTEEAHALADLKKFLIKIEMHTKNILNAYEKMKAELSTHSKETILSMTLAEHLFAPLASGFTCNINEKAQGEGQSKTCKSDCSHSAQFGATGIGHHKVWHGFADVVIKERNNRMGSVCAAKVVTKPNFWDDTGPSRDTLLTDAADDEEDLEASLAKRPKLYENDLSMNGDNISKSKLKTNRRVENQIVAQTIVFSLAQKQQQYPNANSSRFVPNILISDTKFYVIMYEPVKDILIVSGEYLLWDQIPSTSLNPMAIIVLWMVLHYKLFCSGGEIFENPEEVKAGFFDQIRENIEYYEQLLLDASSFETEMEELGCFTSCSRKDSDFFKYVKVNLNR